MPKLTEIFDVWYGVNLEFVNCEEVAGGVPFVSRTANNNGVVGYVREIDGVEPNPGHTLSRGGWERFVDFLSPISILQRAGYIHSQT